MSPSRKNSTPPYRPDSRGPGLFCIHAFLSFLCFGAFAMGQTTYTFTGVQFTSADPPYATSDRVTGSFTVDIPLQPFMSLTDIRHLIADYSFSAGPQTRTPANSEMCDISVATDGVGHILEWRIFLRQSGVAMGDPLETLGSNEFGDQAGSGPAGASACSNISLDIVALNLDPGSWTDSLPTGTPVTYTFDGISFTEVEPPYTTAHRLQGWFTVGNPLPSFTEKIDIGHALTDFSFMDGLQVRQPADTEVCTFEITTNGAGHIIDWTIGLRETPFTMGDPQQSVDSSIFGDLVGSGPADSSACASISPSPSASVNTPGTWSDPLPPGDLTDYLFTGEPFSFVQGPYTTANRLEGFIRVADPLPAFLAKAELGFAVEDFSYFDGVQTRNPSNSALCFLYLTTNANGNIIGWRVSLRELPYTPGIQQRFVDSSNIIDQVGSGPADADPCGPFSADLVAHTIVGGTWDNPIPEPEPVVYRYLGFTYRAADPPYQRDQRVGGRIALPGPLPPNMPLTDISQHLLSFQFLDGVQTRSQYNTSLCWFEIATDASGNIAHWRFLLREPVFNPGDVQSTIQSDHLGFAVGDRCGNGISSGTCSDLMLDIAAVTSTEGYWTQFCPAQLVAFPDWPNPVNILDILNLACP